MIDTVRQALDLLVDVLEQAGRAEAGRAEAGPAQAGRQISFGMQAMRLGDRDLWAGGFSEGDPVGVHADIIDVRTAARQVFAASYDAGAPLRRIDVRLRHVGGDWLRHAMAESVADYLELCGSWRLWQERYAIVVAQAADTLSPAGWEYAECGPPRWRESAGDHLLVRTAGEASKFAVPDVVAALREEINDAFARSGRRVNRLKLHTLADGRSATTWNYRLDAAQVAPLPPPARSGPAVARRVPPGPPPLTPVDRPPRSDPGQHWDRLVRSVTDLMGTGWLQPPASEQDLAGLEAAYGHRIPDALRAGWLRHNGQGPEDYLGRFFGVRWLPVEEVLTHLRQRTPGADRGEVDDHPDRVGSLEALEGEDLSSTPPGAIRLHDVHPGWLPVFGADGSYLAIDMAPGRAGQCRQMIIYENVDDLRRIVVARDFHALLAWMDAEATAGRLVFWCEFEHDEDEDEDHETEGCSLRHADGEYDLINNLAEWCAT